MAENTNRELFREKNLERIASPEQLDDYIKVITPGVWLMLSGIIVLLSGVIAWAVFGILAVENSEGVIEMIHPISFLIN